MTLDKAPLCSDNVLIGRLERFSILAPDDRASLASVLEHVRFVAADAEAMEHDDGAGNVLLLRAGIACQTARAMNGSDAIIKYLLPGDFCNLPALMARSDFTRVRAMTDCEFFVLESQHIDGLLARPGIAKAMMRSLIADESLARGEIFNISSRRSEQRVAHFLCEMYVRLSISGSSADDVVSLPFAQDGLGRSLGISKVHVNRALQNIRRREMIGLKRRRIDILDFQGLKEMCDFDLTYLCA